ncbi:S8 family serine peptidase [Halogranum rubrum]|uniref:Peptidase S8/S53 domain-containing protein n=1 Tax=Halogranum salarium B-1 TaxID=1210908 RepID=J3F025_9EURY|nr:S8 family serine peptidase [Halogranum salarium]EJN61327.1 hypothetical protein HSB1_03680 [Halogranum salarium B-1]
MSRQPRRLAVHFVLALLFVSSFAAPALTDSSVPYGASLTGPSQYDNDLILQRGEMQASLESTNAVEDVEGGPTPDSDVASLHREGSRTTDGVQAIRADELHERGITGEGVSVGVIGSAFDTDNAAIAEQVAGHHASHDQQRTETDHDTAVAEVVTRTTPDADLYLASVGTTPTPESYADAVEWLLANDVDVIVDSGSYFAPMSGDMGQITAVADHASEEGVVFVTSAGNYANRHWAGVADGDQWVEFAPDTEANALEGGNATEGRVSLKLYWNTSADYDLYLYRKTAGRDPVVAKSTVRQTSENASPAETIDVVVPRGVYYVSIYAHEGTANRSETNTTNGTNSTNSTHSANETNRTGRTSGTGLQLFSPHQTLTHTTAAGSMVAPATSERVITVGAIDAKSGLIREYSSLGYAGARPDVGAPDGVSTTTAGTFYGTSAAAPYVAGSAALIKSRQGELSPAQVEQLLQETSHDTGSGRYIDAYAAVEAASGANVTARVEHEP